MIFILRSTTSSCAAWVGLFGSSEIAVRALSALAGTILVLVIFLLGRRLFGEGVGLIAAFLAALSPFQVYYSQEARMYMFATLLAALSTYALVVVATPHAAAGRARRWRDPALWLAYIIFTTAALYSHYFAATVVLAQDVAVALIALRLLWQLRGTASAGAAAGLSTQPWLRSFILPLIVAQIVVALQYLPWLPVMSGQFSNWPAISEFYNLPVLVSRLFPIFSLGLSIEPAAVALLLIIFAILLILGLLPFPRSRHPQLDEATVHAPGTMPGLQAMAPYPQERESGMGGNAPDALSDSESASTSLTDDSTAGFFSGAGGVLLVFCWLAIPVLTMFLLSLRRPLYNPKFLLVAVPAFSLLLGRGVAWLAALPRWASTSAGAGRVLRGAGAVLAAVALAVLTFGSVRSLNAYYNDPHYARDNYRGIVQTIEAGARTGDAIILNAPGQSDIFGYYYDGSLPVIPLPRQRPLNEQATLAELSSIADQNGRLWVVYYGDQQADPRRLMESWLDRQAFKASDRWYSNARLALYALPTDQAAALQPLNDQLGPNIRLQGYQLDSDGVAAGDIVPLTLSWQANSPLIERYTVFAHIIDKQNTLWGQRDSEPASGLRPTTTWQPGETIQDKYGLPILPGTPPGEYQIEIGMYRPDTGQRLQITDSTGKPLGDHILVGPLKVARPVSPPTADNLDMQHASTATPAGLRLLGYNLSRLGQEPGPAEFGANDLLSLTLFWRAASAHGDLSMNVQIVDSKGQVVRNWEGRPAGDYSTADWTTGEVVRDQRRLALGGLPAGQYRLQVVVLDEAGSAGGQADLGTITIK